MREILTARGPLTAPEVAALLDMPAKHVVGQLSNMSRRGMVRKDASVRPCRWIVTRAE
jgi:DNA-binding IclR family transcriptional regulator